MKFDLAINLKQIFCQTNKLIQLLCKYADRVLRTESKALDFNLGRFAKKLFCNIVTRAASGSYIYVFSFMLSVVLRAKSERNPHWQLNNKNLNRVIAKVAAHLHIAASLGCVPTKKTYNVYTRKTALMRVLLAGWFAQYFLL